MRFLTAIYNTLKQRSKAKAEEKRRLSEAFESFIEETRPSTPKANKYPDEYLTNIDFSDDLIFNNISINEISTASYKFQIEESGVYILSACCWYDSAYTNQNILRFLNLDNPGIYLMGDWSHQGINKVNPFNFQAMGIIPNLTMQEGYEILYYMFADFFKDVINDDEWGLISDFFNNISIAR